MSGDAWLVACRRTAIGRAGGRLRGYGVDRLGRAAVRAVLADAGLAASDVDEVRLGNALEGGNVARRVALAGGLPPAAPAVTVDRQCASGLDAIIEAFHSVAAGHAEAVLAGGVESCSTAPWRLSRPSGRDARPEVLARAPFSAPPYADPDPLAGADALAAQCGITRREQDAWVARSHARAIEAAAAGHFEGERVTAGTPDEGPRRGLSETRLSRLPSLLGPQGTATVASVAAEADAAVVALVVSADRARRLGLDRRNVLQLLGAAQAGCDPAVAGYAAVPALARLGRCVSIEQAAGIELNEAFAGQALACIRGAGLSADRVNRYGGALAFGHPFGASGALLVCRLFHDLATGQEGLAAISAMGGQGSAALLRKGPCT